MSEPGQVFWLKEPVPELVLVFDERISEHVSIPKN
jgi:hypothetical protein